MTLLATVKFAAPSTMSDGNIDDGGYPSDEAIAVILFVFDTHAT